MLYVQAMRTSRSSAFLSGLAVLCLAAHVLAEGPAREAPPDPEDLLNESDRALGEAEYPRAKALAERVAADERVTDERVTGRAGLRIAETDRRTRRFKDALKRVEALRSHPDGLVRYQAELLYAQVKYDLEEFAEAKASLEALLPRLSDSEARAVKEQLDKIEAGIARIQKALQVELGPRPRELRLQEGDPLKMVVIPTGIKGDVDVVTSSGDRETLTLESKRGRLFGELPTEVRQTKVGDGTLQITLGDEITCRYMSDEGEEKILTYRIKEIRIPDPID